MEAYRVIFSYLANGTITQLCFIYACTANFLCRFNGDIDRRSYMFKCVIVLFMDCITRQMCYFELFHIL